MRLLIATLAVLGMTGCVLLPDASAQERPADAATVLDLLKARGLPIGETVTYTAESDPNKLLGRPGGYASKVAWRDSRVTPDTEMGVSAGGSVEMFDTVESARARKEYVSKIAASSPLFSEYTFVQGRIVVRVSHDLTPEQAEQYAAVLRDLPS